MHQHIPAVSAVFLFYSIHHFILAGTVCRQYGYSLFFFPRELLLPEGGNLGAKHDEIRKELVSMCNLGEAIEENALRKGRSQGRKEGKSAGKKAFEGPNAAHPSKAFHLTYISVMVSGKYLRSGMENIILTGYA